MNKPPSPLMRRLVKGVALLAVLSTLSACIVVPSRGWGRGHGHYGQATPQSVPHTVPQVAAAPPMYFVPERGQPQAVQERERYECYQWAVRETKFDPGMTPTVAAAAPARVGYQGSQGPHGGEVVAGAATGAVMGAVVGGPRRAPEAMVIGAIFGAMVGAAAQDQRARDEARADARADARYASAVQQAGVPMNNFRRAMSACMQGRGYRVTA